MNRNVITIIVKEKYVREKTRDAVYLAELTLADSDRKGQEFAGSPRRFGSFEDIAFLLVRETGATHEVLQAAKGKYDREGKATLSMKLNDEQIKFLGFSPES